MICRNAYVFLYEKFYKRSMNDECSLKRAILLGISHKNIKEIWQVRAWHIKLTISKRLNISNFWKYKEESITLSKNIIKTWMWY